MADGVNYTQGSGIVIASDDVGGLHYQVIKLAIGALDVATLLTFGQATKANSLPVALSSDQEPAACGGALLTTLITVSTTATLIPATAQTNRRRITVQNQGTASVFIGGSGVTTSGSTKGIELKVGVSLALELKSTALVYGIVASGTQSVVALEISSA